MTEDEGTESADGDVEALVLDVELTPGDWQAFVDHLTRGCHRKVPLWLRACGVIVQVVVFALATYGALRLRGVGPSLLVGLGLALVLSPLARAMAQRAMQRALQPRPGGATLGPHRLGIDAGGITRTADGSRAESAWPLLDRVEVTPQFAVLFTDAANGHCIPRRCIDDDTLARLRALVTRFAPQAAWIEASGTTTSSSLPGRRAARAAPVLTGTIAPVGPAVARDRSADAPAGARAGAVPPSTGLAPANDSHEPRSLLGNLAGGAGWALLRPWRGAVLGGPRVLLAQVLLVLALVTAIDWLTVPAPRFYWNGAEASLAARLLSVVAVLWLGATLLGVRRRTERALVMFTAALPLPLLVFALGAWHGWMEQPFRPTDLSSGAMLWLLWMALLAGRALGAVAPRADVRRGAVVPVTVVLVFVLNVHLGPTRLWFHYDEDGDDRAPDLDVEAVFHAQHDLLADAVSRLAPQRPGVADLYFVGFGGYAREDVFRKEIDFVSELLARRFDTGSRSLALVNHRDTVTTTPLANGHNLADALQAIGEVMDADEDVLFLYLTSHGSRGGQLSVEFWPLALNDLTAAQLGDMLDASGIRWRVVIVSGCYAGGFIDRLAGPGTVVMTAADAENTSFGCGPGNEMTWFGEAYFRDALGQGDDFLAAFEHARTIIEQREKAGGMTASNPQIRVGDDIRRHLERLAPGGGRDVR